MVLVFIFIVSVGFHTNSRRGKVFSFRDLATEEKKLQQVFVLDLLLSDGMQGLDFLPGNINFIICQNFFGLFSFSDEMP